MLSYQLIYCKSLAFAWTFQFSQIVPVCFPYQKKLQCVVQSICYFHCGTVWALFIIISCEGDLMVCFRCRIGYNKGYAKERRLLFQTLFFLNQIDVYFLILLNFTIFPYLRSILFSARFPICWFWPHLASLERHMRKNISQLSFLC